MRCWNAGQQGSLRSLRCVKKMRPTFYVDLDCRVHSCNAPKERPHCFKPGDTLWLAEPFAYEYGPIPAGTKVFVSHVAPEDGAMWLMAEGDVPALYHSDNFIVAVPWDTEDLLMCLRADVRLPEAAMVPGLPLTSLEPDPSLPPSNVRRLGKLVAIAAVTVLACSLPQRMGSDHGWLAFNVDQHATFGTFNVPTG
jgi:hypothetical protein